MGDSYVRYMMPVFNSDEWLLALTPKAGSYDLATFLTRYSFPIWIERNHGTSQKTDRMANFMWGMVREWHLNMQVVR